MGNVIKFRPARKKRLRQNAEAQAAAQRLLHGRSKVERRRDAARNAKTRSELDQHRVDRGDER
jgi:Domain of unknown function (DUF4169)